MNLEVILLDKQATKYQKEVKQKARRLAKFLPKRGVIEVYIVSGKRMRALNKRFRRKNKLTNVLSFQAPLNFPTDTLGEVYLDPKYIEKKKEDLVFMLVHGVLHILGYDHEKRSDRIRMEKMEQELLQKLVISN